MSTVTSMIITCSLLEGPAVGTLNEWLIARARPPFAPIYLETSGGSKAMQIDAWAVAINGYNPDELIEHFAKLPWGWPSEALLMIYPEDGPPTIATGDGASPVVS